ncbi:MAG: alpha-galactosidase [Sphingobacteriaceae bacterium]|jgi:alpha-galactosidase|nr:alpha-galactosidase [Sphingobacteriaceae bacterium]
MKSLKQPILVSLKLAFCLSLSLVVFSASSQTITETSTPKGWLIKTKSSQYQIVLTPAGKVKPLYFGVAGQTDYGNKNTPWFEDIDEVPVRGELPFKVPVLEVIFSDHVRDAALEFVSAEISSLDKHPLLKIVQKDKVYPLQVTSYIRVLPEYDILEKWISVRNTAKKGNIQVENLLSGSIVLPSDEYKLTQLSGLPNTEFQIVKTDVTAGMKTIDIKGSKSTFHAPWFLAEPKSSDGSSGRAWFGSVHYSGNWALHFDKVFNGTLQIVGGINFWDSALTLEPRESFSTPKFSVGFTTKGAEGAARSHAAYIRNEILPEPHRNDLRPVLYNSWYATKQYLNEDQQVELAKVAAEVGAELFMVDAGWYKVSGTDWHEIGDWEIDNKKFPNGLTSLIQRVNALGMKFGLWVEPENIYVTSETYKKHPDWALHFPNRDGNPRKTLNLAKEDVYQYLLNTLDGILSSNKIDYIKWDQNSFLREPGWPDAPVEMQREVRIRMTANLYRLIDELKKRHPNVWFESCASGGGRTDPGILSRMDMAWVSDNTTALDRLMIQYGYLSAFPANTMISWVIGAGPVQSLDYKFDVAMCGVLGIGDNISKWTAADKEIARKKIETYKLIRPLIQQGILYRLRSPFTTDNSALQYNSPDSLSSVLICHNMAKYLEGSQDRTRGSKTLRLQGLRPEKNYVVKNAANKDEKGTVYTGEFLMNVGIAWPLTKEYESRIILINPTK